MPNIIADYMNQNAKVEGECNREINIKNGFIGAQKMTK